MIKFQVVPPFLSMLKVIVVVLFNIPDIPIFFKYTCIFHNSIIGYIGDALMLTMVFVSLPFLIVYDHFKSMVTSRSEKKMSPLYKCLETEKVVNECCNVLHTLNNEQKDGVHCTLNSIGALCHKM